MSPSFSSPTSSETGSPVPIPPAPMVRPCHLVRHEGPTRRILHVINGEHYSGAERVQDLLAARLPEFGYEVGFACVKPGQFVRYRSYTAAPVFDAPMEFKCDWRAAQQLVEVARSGGYDALHAHTPRSLFIARLASLRLRCPLFYHVHSPVGRDSKRLLANRVNAWTERILLYKTARILCVSESLFQYMVSLGHRPEQLRVVRNGVPVRERTALLPPVDGPWVLGMIALFRPRKGLELLLEALSDLRGRSGPFRLLAVGAFESQHYQKRILQLARQLGVADLIEWTGFERDVARRLSDMHALILPSLFGEGLPMVVLEAMAQGVPVIASRVEGTPEAIRHQQEGLLFEPRDARGLADQLAYLMEHPDEWSRLSEAAWHRQRDELSDHVMAERLAATYNEVLSPA